MSFRLVRVITREQSERGNLDANKKETQFIFPLTGVRLSFVSCTHPLIP